MVPSARHLLIPPYVEALPAPIWFRTAELPAAASYPQHRHPWGEFVYSFSGVLEVKLANHHYLAPPPQGVWLPPGVEHRGLNRHPACHASLYVSPAQAAGLPRETCALLVNALVRALLHHLRQNPLALPPTPSEARLLQVLVDQLAEAPRVGTYLPSSQDPLLMPVLAALEENPADSRPLEAWAAQVHSTGRTLQRRCLRDLGMSLGAWRQRLRVVRAMQRLEAGQGVEAIALDLGYGSASAFIAMFRRLVGVPPDEYRRHWLGSPGQMGVSPGELPRESWPQGS